MAVIKKMTLNNEKYSRELIDHFFRNEHGKMVSVITKYIGTVLSKVKGNKYAILELKKLKKNSKIDYNHLLYSTLAELYKLENDIEKAKISYKKAISLTKNKRDTKFLQKKLIEIVPI